MFYVYIVLCMDGTFYTGYTKDLGQRATQHANGKGARYTKTHRFQKIVYTEPFATRSEAMKRERALKKLNHQQKQDIVNARDNQGKTDKQS